MPSDLPFLPVPPAPPGSPLIPSPPSPSSSRNDPFRGFRFRVKVGGFGYLDTGVSSVGAFSQCSGIKATNHILKMRTGADIRGVQGIIPATVEYSNLVLSRGVIADNAFLDWVFSCMPGYVLGPTPGGRKTIDITVLNDKGEEGVTWTLHGAYPVSYELASLDASSDSVLMESLEFAYAGLSRSVK